MNQRPQKWHPQGQRKGGDRATNTSPPEWFSSFQVGEKFSEFPPDKMVKLAEDIGKDLSREDLSTQLRKIFFSAKKLEHLKEEEIPSEAYLLGPRYLYTAVRKLEQKQRNPSEAVRRFVYFARLLTNIIPTLKDRQDVKYFVKFIEAVIAYQRYYSSASKNR